MISFFCKSEEKNYLKKRRKVPRLTAIIAVSVATKDRFLSCELFEVSESPTVNGKGLDNKVPTPDGGW
jgi:hypothetical protein